MCIPCRETKVYKNELQLFAYRHAVDYVDRGFEFLYGIAKFDYKSFGIEREQATKDYNNLFEGYVSQIRREDEIYK